VEILAISVESSATTIKVARSLRKRSYASIDSEETVDSPRANRSRLKASNVSATVMAGLAMEFKSIAVALVVWISFPPWHHRRVARTDSKTKAIGAKTIAFHR